MITDIGVFIGEEISEQEMKEIVAGFCDILVDTGYATSKEESESSKIKTFITVKTYEITDGEASEFIEHALLDAELAVIPIIPEEVLSG